MEGIYYETLAQVVEQIRTNWNTLIPYMVQVAITAEQDVKQRNNSGDANFYIPQRVAIEATR
jgi:hypothetical protein